MRNIENRPMGCGRCGAQVNGRESSMNTREGLLHECRWTCPRCGTLIRVEEEYDKETK
jgi:ribosomal protein S27AE